MGKEVMRFTKAERSERARRSVRLRSAAFALSALSLGVWVSACASSGASGSAAGSGTEGDRPPIPTVSSEQEVAPLTIEALDLREGLGETRLEIRADDSLVWTSYQDQEGRVIVELPNSRPSSSLLGIQRGEGPVESVDIEERGTATRPLTRIVVTPKSAVEHALRNEGDLLVLSLRQDEAAAAAAAGMGEPAEAQDLPAERAAVLEPAVEPRPLPTLGTPEAPVVGPPVTAEPASRLYDVDVVARDADETVLAISGDGEFAYSSFRLGDPERFVIDLAGVVNSSSGSSFEVGSPTVERIRVAQFKPYPDPVSRIVVDLEEGAVPTLTRQGDQLVIRVEPMSAFTGEGAARVARREPSPAVPPVSQPMVETPATEPEAVAEVEPAPYTPYQTEPLTEQAEPMGAERGVEMAEADLEPEPEIETQLAAAQVAQENEIRLAPEPQRVEMAPAPTPEARVPVSTTVRAVPTTDAALYDVRELTVPAEEASSVQDSFATQSFSTPSKKYVGDPIDLSFRDADVVETLRFFSSYSGLNIVIQPDVSGRVTVELKQVPWDQALEQILKINQLGYELDGNIMRIAPLKTLQAEAQARQALEQAKSLSVPLQTVVKRLSYADGRKMESLLRRGRRSQSGGGRNAALSADTGILSARGTVIVDERTNTLIIKELPSYMDTVLAIISTLDSPEPQVMIEARIIETTKRFTRQLGVDWATNAVASAGTGNTTGLQFPNNVTSSGGVNLLGNTPANGFLQLGLGNILNTFRLDATLQAAESEGLVNILSAPKIATLNNTKAEIQSGLQIPIQTIVNDTITVQYINATLRLEVTPRITAEGTVVLDILIQKKEPQLAFALAGARNAPIGTKEAKTQVLVRDGGTAVIGGIYEVSTDQGTDRVPGLANIPILGNLFKSKRRQDENEELLIFITPRVIKL